MTVMTERAQDGDDGVRRCELETGDYGGELETITTRRYSDSPKETQRRWWCDKLGFIV